MTAENVELAEPVVGIACSGGGIRSACFALGALQELRRQGVFSEQVTVAAVSGGSFAATAYLATCATSEIEPGDPAPWAIDSPEMRQLRSRSDYLASGSFERFWLVLSAIRSSIVNLSTAVLIVIALGSLGGATASLLERIDDRELVTQLGMIPAVGMFIVSLFVVWRNSSGARKHRFKERPGHYRPWSDSLVSKVAVGAVVSSAFVLFALDLLPRVIDVLHDHIGKPSNDPSQLRFGFLPSRGPKSALYFTVSGLAAVAGFTLISFALPRPWRRRLRGTVAVVLVFLILSGPLLWAYDGARVFPPFFGYRAAAAVFATVFVLYRCFDANAYSLLPIYRRSLRRTLFWRRTGTTCVGDIGPESQRVEGFGPGDISRMTLTELHSMIGLGHNPCAFTGSEESQLNIQQPNASTDDVRELSKHSSYLDRQTRLVVLGAVNLADRTAQLGAKVENIQFSQGVTSPMFGESVMTYESQPLGDSDRLDLASVVAISGAAVSPTMGRFTRRGLSALLALLNMRLGAWLVNPESDWLKKKTNRTLRRKKGSRPIRTPRATPLNVLREALVASSKSGRHIFVTDGGHFENLGLVALAESGASTIISLDASLEAPGKLTALHYSLQLLRARGFSFDIGPPVESDDDGVLQSPITQGILTSPTDTEIRFIHLRCERFAGMSPDLASLCDRDSRFPRHPTLHQFFSAELVDGYFLLGGDVARRAEAAISSAVWHESAELDLADGGVPDKQAVREQTITSPS